MSKKPLRSIKLEGGKLEMKDEFELIFERTITKFGNGAKIDAPKRSSWKKSLCYS